jgi:hypothetical protein
MVNNMNNLYSPRVETSARAISAATQQSKIAVVTTG